MNLKPASILFSLVLACQSAAMAGEDAIAIGQWRTELGKALVCGGEEADTIIDIATSANAFYSSGANSGSPEYEAYFSLLEKARNERRCFVTAKMRHLPDSIVYSGPESLEEKHVNLWKDHIRAIVVAYEAARRVLDSYAVDSIITYNNMNLISVRLAIIPAIYGVFHSMSFHRAN